MKQIKNKELLDKLAQVEEEFGPPFAMNADLAEAVELPEIFYEWDLSEEKD